MRRAQISWWGWFLAALLLAGVLLWFIARNGAGIVDFFQNFGT